MHIFREELKSTKTSRKKLTQRLRQLRVFVFWHYVLLLFSSISALFTLFVALNVSGVPYQGVMFVFSLVSLGLSCWLLLAGLTK